LPTSMTTPSAHEVGFDILNEAKATRDSLLQCVNHSSEVGS